MLNVQLPHFEGPLGLLLYLIRKEEMDILNINIVEITKQYLDHIQLMKDLDLEVAGDFVSMAATLIHIKSRMLLPQYNEEGEVVESEDPRRELVQKLLEYEKFQEASKQLYARPLLGRDVWPRGEALTLAATEEIVIEEGGLFTLISAYRNLMQSLKNKVHRVAAKGQSIASRILEIRNRFLRGERISFGKLFQIEEAIPQKVLITFLSILELGKLGFVSLFQAEPMGPIYIDTLREVEGNVISQVEEFNYAESAKNLEHMMEESQVEHDHQMREEVAFGHLPEDSSAGPISADELNYEEGGVTPATDEEIFAAEMELSEADLAYASQEIVPALEPLEPNEEGKT